MNGSRAEREWERERERIERHARVYTIFDSASETLAGMWIKSEEWCRWPGQEDANCVWPDQVISLMSPSVEVCSLFCLLLSLFTVDIYLRALVNLPNTRQTLLAHRHPKREASCVSVTVCVHLRWAWLTFGSERQRLTRVIQLYQSTRLYISMGHITFGPKARGDQVTG